jgi:hypothetical protein
MSSEFVLYKRKLSNDLRPVFAMLQEKKTQMEKQEWELEVRKTFDRISLNPTEYLRDEAPIKVNPSDALAEIEMEFLKEVRLLR